VTTPTLHRPVLGGTRGTTRPGNAPLRGAEEADSSADPVAVPGAGHVGVLDVSSAPPPERRRAGCRRGRAATPGEGGADPQAAGHLHPQSAAPCWDGGLELSPCPRRQSTHPAGSTSTLAGPNFGPKNGVHLTSRIRNSTKSTPYCKPIRGRMMRAISGYSRPTIRSTFRNHGLGMRW